MCEDCYVQCSRKFVRRRHYSTFQGILSVAWAYGKTALAITVVCGGK